MLILTYLDSFLVPQEHKNESLQIGDDSKYNMVTNEEYEELYLLTRKIVRFVNLLTNKADRYSELSKYLKTIGCSFNNNLTLKDYVQLIIGKDILNCYFLLGYQQFYQRELYILLDMIEYGFHIQDVPWSYNEFLNLYGQYSDYFCKMFDIKKNAIKSYDFPALYIYLSVVGNTRADEYVSLLQKIANVLSRNQNEMPYEKDPRMDVLLTYPQAFLYSQDDNNESQQIDDDRDIQQIEEDNSGFNTDNNCQTMNLLKDKLYNGISFEIIGEEYHKGSSLPFRLYLRISNYNDQKKKISVDIKYISEKHGLKTRSGIFGEFVPDNSFVDLNIGFEDITGAYNGDRIEMEINEGKFASLRLIREKGQWAIVESIERSTYNRELKNKVENFEAIEEQFGITLQNFSVKVEDENSLKVFCEVLALNGEIPKNDFTINIAIYDNNNEIVYTDSESKYAEEFKGFEVLTFDYIKLDITVDEISKIRIYPTR